MCLFKGGGFKANLKTLLNYHILPAIWGKKKVQVFFSVLKAVYILLLAP